MTTAFNKMVLSLQEYIERLKQSMEIESEMKERELLMEAQIKDAQVRYLQAQINPHFLFNTLNAGAQLAMMEDAPRTYQYIQNVADFFRYNIKTDQRSVALKQEIALVDNYIYILNVRFSGDIHYQKNIEEDLVDVQVPNMILQPIVENAVNYGIRNIDWEGHIDLSVYRKEDEICISIRDNGIGMSPEIIQQIMDGSLAENQQHQDSNGVGLDNVISRLRLFYGGEHVIEFISQGKNMGTEVIIYIPFQEGEKVCIE